MWRCSLDDHEVKKTRNSDKTLTLPLTPPVLYRELFEGSCPSGVFELKSIESTRVRWSVTKLQVCRNLDISGTWQELGHVPNDLGRPFDRTRCPVWHLSRLSFQLLYRSLQSEVNGARGFLHVSNSVLSTRTRKYGSDWMISTYFLHVRHTHTRSDN